VHRRTGDQLALVAAAPLHDIGHLIGFAPPDLNDWLAPSKPVATVERR